MYTTKKKRKRINHQGMDLKSSVRYRNHIYSFFLQPPTPMYIPPPPQIPSPPQVVQQPVKSAKHNHPPPRISPRMYSVRLLFVYISTYSLFHRTVTQSQSTKELFFFSAIRIKFLKMILSQQNCDWLCAGRDVASCLVGAHYHCCHLAASVER